MKNFHEMMKNFHKNKVLFVIGIMILILSLTGVNYLIYKGKNAQEIPKVKLKDQKTKNDSFAIMLQQDDGTYKETESTSFNQEGYVFNSTKSGCIDANGNKVENALTYYSNTKAIGVTTNKTVFCYVYFDIKQIDVDVAIKTEGVSGKLPTASGYKNALVCSEGTGTFNNKYQRLEITNARTKCTLNYERDTDTHTSLVNKVTSLAGTTQGNGKLVHEEFTADKFTPGTILDQADYMYLNNGTIINSDTTYPWTWNDTDKSWTSSNKIDSSFTVITFSPNSDGYYQICYTQSSDGNDYGTVYKNDTQILSLYGKYTINECKYLGHLSTSDIIKVTYQKDGSGSTGNDEISFYIQTGTYTENYETISAGYRYEGTNPNNYIWFNNEMWRIIGSIPTKVDASGTTTNLVKIIRKDSLGGITYDAKESGYTGSWGSNTLYTLLNDYYYGKKDGTNTDYCYLYPTISKTKCDYSVIGISDSSTDYYGRMVKNVYWNTGASDFNATVNTSYTNEKVTQTVQGRIGLMSASDFSYAASSANHDSTEQVKYDTSDITLSNWLYGQGFIEWTNTLSSDSAEYVLGVIMAGPVSSYSTNFGYAYRPVVYLNENVYVISGSGTEADPYIIGM